MKTLRENMGPTLLIVGMLALFTLTVFIGTYNRALGNITSVQPGGTPPDLNTYTFFATSTNQQTVSGSTYNATSTTATSTNITSWTDSNGTIDKGWANIAGAKKVTFYFTRGDRTGTGNSGSTDFWVQVTPDGTNWYYWDKWQENATSTLGQTAKSQSTGQFRLLSTSTVVASMDLTLDSFLGARVIEVETTDGDHAAAVTVQR